MGTCGGKTIERSETMGPQPSHEKAKHSPPDDIVGGFYDQALLISHKRSKDESTDPQPSRAVKHVQAKHRQPPDIFFGFYDEALHGSDTA